MQRKYKYGINNKNETINEQNKKVVRKKQYRRSTRAKSPNS